MAKRVGKLAYRYAHALFRSVRSELNANGAYEQRITELERDVAIFARAWEENKRLRDFLLNPMFESRRRLSQLHKIVDALELSGKAKQFISVIFERDRISLIPEIAEALSVIANRERGVVLVAITTAQQLSVGEADDITRLLGDKIEGHLQFSWSVDPSLLGGIIVRYQGKVIDGSIRGGLEGMQRSLLGS